LDECPDTGYSTATTITAVNVASNSMPQLMIRARRRSCFLWFAGRGCAGVAPDGAERAMGRLPAFEGVPPMGLPAEQLVVCQDMHYW
jgi:hypothetical protein